jgi:ribonuclease T2
VRRSAYINLVAVVALVAAAVAFNWLNAGQPSRNDAERETRSQQSSDEPGQFDFYVLALSWSPTYCEEQSDDDGMQCNSGRPFSFVVHGLWPQNERGWPQFCDTSFGERIERRIADQMLDIMPARDLVFHQWRKHGVCSGLSPDDFFALTRQAKQAVTIPAAYKALSTYQSVAVRDVEAAFIAANPGLTANGIAVTCSNRFLREVRICLDKSLNYRTCAEVNAKACQKEKIVMPPVRG